MGAMIRDEIRDKETAEIATHAALTGQLVLSTLHTNDAPSAITRLVELGHRLPRADGDVRCGVDGRRAQGAGRRGAPGWRDPSAGDGQGDGHAPGRRAPAGAGWGHDD